IEQSLIAPSSSHYLRHTPTYTLFPYTTLFRSRGEELFAGAGDARTGVHRRHAVHRPRFPVPRALRDVPADDPVAPQPHENLAMRSEEHTSELQSHLNLVCRLLLEKRKDEAVVI